MALRASCDASLLIVCYLYVMAIIHSCVIVSCLLPALSLPRVDPELYELSFHGLKRAMPKGETVRDASPTPHIAAVKRARSTDTTCTQTKHVTSCTHTHLQAHYCPFTLNTTTAAILFSQLTSMSFDLSARLELDLVSSQAVREATERELKHR